MFIHVGLISSCLFWYCWLFISTYFLLYFLMLELRACFMCAHFFFVFFFFAIKPQTFSVLSRSVTYLPQLSWSSKSAPVVSQILILEPGESLKEKHRVIWSRLIPFISFHPHFIRLKSMWETRSQECWLKLIRCLLFEKKKGRLTLCDSTGHFL